MRVNKRRANNYPIPSRLVCQIILWISSSLMYGVQLQLLLGETIIMCHLLMILANLHGFIFFDTNMRFSSIFMIFKTLLNACLIGKLLQCKLTGVGSIST
jgi:hypothetical protein